MMDIFYHSGIDWFDNMANGLCWFLIFAAVAFLAWVGFDMITGPRRQRAEVVRMLAGLDTAKDISGVGVLNSHKNISTSDKPKTRPFGPKKVNKAPDLTAKS